MRRSESIANRKGSKLQMIRSYVDVFGKLRRDYFGSQNRKEEANGTSAQRMNKS